MKHPAPKPPRTAAAPVVDFRAVLLGAALAGVPGLAHAGGTTEQVEVIRFEPSGRDAYELVLAPVGTAANPWAPGCRAYTIRGDLRRLAGTWNPWGGGRPSRAQHREALARLGEAAQSRRTLQFGWIGAGLRRADAATPCVLFSRGLALLPVQAGGTTGPAVVSYYDAV